MWSSYSNPSLLPEMTDSLFKIPSSYANTYLLRAPDNLRNTYLRAINKSTDSRLLTCPSQTSAPSVAFCLLLATGCAIGTQVPCFPSSIPSSRPAVQGCKKFLQRDQLRWGVTGASTISCSSGLLVMSRQLNYQAHLSFNGFFPPCSCRSFERIKVCSAAMWRKGAALKRSTDTEFNKSFVLFGILWIIYIIGGGRLPVIEAEGWVPKCPMKQLQSWINSGWALRKPGKLCPAMQGSTVEENLRAAEIAHIMPLIPDAVSIQ